MPNTGLIIDIAELLQKQFGSRPYVVPGASKTGVQLEPYKLNTGDDVPRGSHEKGYQVDTQITKAEREFTAKGSLIGEQYRGVDILLPVRFYNGPLMVAYIPYCVLHIGGKKTLIETPLVERKGEVIEQYNINNYSIGIKGFMISEDKKFPERDITGFKNLFEANKALTIENALTNIFLSDKTLPQDEQRRVVIRDFDFPEVQGGRINVKPFTMQLKSDSIFKLELIK